MGPRSFRFLSTELAKPLFASDGAGVVATASEAVDTELQVVQLWSASTPRRSHPTGRLAKLIALACLHSGVFIRAQWSRFLNAHPEQVRRGAQPLVTSGVAAEETVPHIRGIGRVCRIVGRRLYRALGVEDIRHRQIASPTVLMRRLLSLDYLL